MIIDLSCPIELRGYELLSDDHGNTRAYIKLRNLSEKSVISYTATVSWHNGDTQERVNENIEVDAFEIAPKSAFKLVHSTKNQGFFDHVEMYFASVGFSDGEKWTPKDGALIDVGEQKILKGAELDRLREAAGNDAVQYPQVQKDYWRCVCGRINLLTDDVCIRCERERREVLMKLNAKQFHVKAERDTKRPPRRRKNKAQERKNKALRMIGLAVLIVLVIALAIIGYTIGTHGGLKLPSPTNTPVPNDSAPYSVSRHIFL